MSFIIHVKSTRMRPGGEFVEVRFSRDNPHPKDPRQAFIGLGSLHMSRKACDELLAVLARGNRENSIRVEEVTSFKHPSKLTHLSPERQSP